MHVKSINACLFYNKKPKIIYWILHRGSDVITDYLNRIFLSLQTGKRNIQKLSLDTQCLIENCSRMKLNPSSQATDFHDERLALRNSTV